MRSTEYQVPGTDIQAVVVLVVCDSVPMVMAPGRSTRVPGTWYQAKVDITLTWANDVSTEPQSLNHRSEKQTTEVMMHGIPQGVTC